MSGEAAREARAEAERRTEKMGPGAPGHGPIWDAGYRMGFVAGAEWAATRAAGDEVVRERPIEPHSTITAADERVDAVARALFLHEHPSHEGAWDAPGEFGKAGWRGRARAALAALRPDAATTGGES